MLLQQQPLLQVLERVAKLPDHPKWHDVGQELYGTVVRRWPLSICMRGLEQRRVCTCV